MNAPVKYNHERLMTVLLAPVVSEKGTYHRGQARAGDLPRRCRDATKPEIKAAVELMFKVQVESGPDRQRQGQGKALRPVHRPPPQLEEGLRLSEARPGNQLRGGEPDHGLVKVKPTSAGRRALVKVVNPNLHKGAPVAALVESQKRGSGRNNNGHITMRHKGGGHKQHYRHRRLQAQQGRHRRQGRAARIRPEPQRQHRAAAATPTASAATSSRRAASRSGTQLMSGAEAPIKPGNTLPLRNIPVGTTVHCIEMQPGKGAQIARSAGTVGAAAGARRRLRAAAASLRRNPQGARRLPRDDRRSRQRGAQPALDRQGRRESLARHPSDGARHCDEPGRPPARRRRRQRRRRIRCRRGARRPRATRRAATSAPT